MRRCRRTLVTSMLVAGQSESLIVTSLDTGDSSGSTTAFALMVNVAETCLAIARSVRVQ